MENPRKKESMDSELARGHVSKFYWWVVLLVGSNKKSSVRACKSYCMNFNSFKIVDSSLP